jgi:small subunit ribosomal protein S29
MGAITSSDPMFSVPLELRDALKLDYDHPMSPYDKRSPVLLEYTQGLKALPVPEKLTIEEASSLMSIWRNENVLVGGKLFYLLIEIR